MTSIDQPHHVDGLESLSTADPFVIAEIGVNHDGDPARAEALVDAAAEAGADAVKFQWFEPRRLLSRSARLAAYQAAAGEHEWRAGGEPHAGRLNVLEVHPLSVTPR